MPIEGYIHKLALIHVSVHDRLICSRDLVNSFVLEAHLLALAE